MSVKRIYQASSEIIFEDLKKHPSVVADRDLSRLMEGVSECLAEMSEPRYERCVPDEVCGTIATIIGMMCLGKSDAPVIMVSSAPDKKKSAALLKKAVAALKQMGYLHEQVSVVEKLPKSRYFCTKRYRNALANGRTFVNVKEDALLVDKLEPSAASRLCVQNCSNSCKHRENCKYRHLMDKMLDGSAKIQVYDEQQYCAALDVNRLPKSRMVVFSVSGRKVITGDATRVLTEREIRSLLNVIAAHRPKTKKKRVVVDKECNNIRDCARKLYAMAAVATNEERAKELLVSIVKSLREIRNVARTDLRVVEPFQAKKRDPARAYDTVVDESELFKALTMVINKIDKMVNAESFTVTHKNQGKRTLVAA